MEITFSLPHVFYPGSNRDENAYALRILLDCLVRLNRAFLRAHSVPTLYQSGVRYRRTEVWDPIPALYTRGYGDCKSLTAARIAELIEAGTPAVPVFRWAEKPNGAVMYHILVQTDEGFEDPSKRLGMGQDELLWFR